MQRPVGGGCQPCKRTAMKPAIWLAAITALTFITCKKSGTETGAGELTIPLHQCRMSFLGGRPVQLCYDSLIFENRCPEPYWCFTSGPVAGSFSFIVGENKHTLRLGSAKWPGHFTTDTIVENCKIEFVTIDPYPGRQNPPPAQAKVTITGM